VRPGRPSSPLLSREIIGRSLFTEIVGLIQSGFREEKRVDRGNWLGMGVYLRMSGLNQCRRLKSQQGEGRGGGLGYRFGGEKDEGSSLDCERCTTQL